MRTHVAVRPCALIGVPDEVRLVPAIPETPAGTIQLHELRNQVVQLNRTVITGLSSAPPTR